MFGNRNKAQMTGEHTFHVCWLGPTPTTTCSPDDHQVTTKSLRTVESDESDLPPLKLSVHSIMKTY